MGKKAAVAKSKAKAAAAKTTSSVAPAAQPKPATAPSGARSIKRNPSHIETDIGLEGPRLRKYDSDELKKATTKDGVTLRDFIKHADHGPVGI